MPETEPPWKRPSSDIKTRRPSCSKSWVSNHSDLGPSSGSLRMNLGRRKKLVQFIQLERSHPMVFYLFPGDSASTAGTSITGSVTGGDGGGGGSSGAATVGDGGVGGGMGDELGAGVVFGSGVAGEIVSISAPLSSLNWRNCKAGKQCRSRRSVSSSSSSSCGSSPSSSNSSSLSPLLPLLNCFNCSSAILRDKNMKNQRNAKTLLMESRQYKQMTFILGNQDRFLEMDKHLGNPETCQLRDMNNNYWTLPAPRDFIDLICNAI